MKSKIRIYCLTLCFGFLLLAGSGAKIVSGQVPDPAAPGPLAVTTEEYNFGDTAFTPTNFPGPVELIGSVHYPTSLSGPSPLIILLHGRHATCFQGGGAQFLEWPCAMGRQPIPSYKGYDYLADVLA